MLHHTQLENRVQRGWNERGETCRGYMRICVPRAAAARAGLMTPSNFSVMALGRAGARTTSFHPGASLQRYFSAGVIYRLIDGIAHVGV